MPFYLFYEFLQIVFIVLLRAFSFFSRNKKLKRFLELRNPFLFINKINEISDKFNELKKNRNGIKIYWIHVSSAGELEQAIPIARYFLTQIDAVFFLTYYSPSAEPFIKNFPSLIGSTGLPIDLSFIYNKILCTVNCFIF